MITNEKAHAQGRYDAHKGNTLQMGMHSDYYEGFERESARIDAKEGSVPPLDASETYLRTYAERIG